MSDDAELFDEINARHFGGSLPSVKVLRATLEADALGTCHVETGAVRLRESLDGDDLRAALLHECIHLAVRQRIGPLVGLGSGHGRDFVAELRRLAESEPCLGSQVARYSAEVEARFATADRRCAESQRRISERIGRPAVRRGGRL